MSFLNSLYKYNCFYFKIIYISGTGDAGKSTFAKQMTKIHKGGFSKEEFERFSDVLRDNCLTSMQVLLNAIKDWKIEFNKVLSLFLNFQFFSILLIYNL